MVAAEEQVQVAKAKLAEARAGSRYRKQLLEKLKEKHRPAVDKDSVEAAKRKAAVARAKYEQAAACALEAARALRRANTPAEKAPAEANLDPALVLVDAAAADAAAADTNVARAQALEEMDRVEKAKPKDQPKAKEEPPAPKGDQKKADETIPVVGVPQLDMPKVSEKIIVHGILEGVDAKKSTITVKGVRGNDVWSGMTLVAFTSDKKPAKGGAADALLKEFDPDSYPKLMNVPVRGNAHPVIGIGVGMAKMELKMEDLKPGQVVQLQLAPGRTTGFVVVFVRVVSEEKKEKNP